MHIQTTRLDEVTVTLTAHEDAHGRLLLAEVTADAAPETAAEPAPAQVAVVIDRSGSMSGRKLQITREACARLIRSLRPVDRIGVTVYDDEVVVLAEPSAPSEGLARAVEGVESRGRTNLYGGWRTGAEMAGTGGRVILLSDGLANCGRCTDAASLARHAGISYERYRVTTSTIGVGEDYDTALMAGMARTGGGAHYFAHAIEAIVDAFSQERFSLGAVALSQVSLRYGGQTRRLGHLWYGETRRVVLRVSDLDDPPATLRYTPAGGNQVTCQLEMPNEFAHSDAATLEHLLDAAAQLEEQAVEVRSPDQARAAREEIRRLVLKLLSHPLADTDLARAVVGRLQAAMGRLERLERDFDAREASLHWKRSVQSGHNIRQRAKAFSAFDDEQEAVADLACAAMHLPGPAAAALVVEPGAVRLAPIDRWRAWQAIPSRRRGRTLEVLMLHPRDGFLIRQMEQELGMQVRPVFRRVTAQEISDGLDELAAAGF